ncbi:MAG: SHOCT domain-containing protein [Candidatus Bathyarchaeia archaeon]
MLLSISAIISSAATGSYPVEEVAAQTYYDYYIPYYYPYSSYLARGRYVVTISISGLPSEYSVDINVNGNLAGTVQGGSSKQFEVRSTESNIFQVESYVSAGEGTRYFCRESSWTLEKAARPYPYYYPYVPLYYPIVYYSTDSTSPPSVYYYYPSVYYYPYYYPDPYARTRLEASHTFTYTPEYMLVVENPSGQSVEKSGWKSADATVTLATSEKIEKSNVERSIFKFWNIDGSEVTSSTITLKMDMPHKAKATYKTQYYLEVRSELDQPQGSGWYDEGSEASVSVLPEVPMTGFWGSLGARYVFESWTAPSGMNQYSPATRVTVDRPTVVTAVWRQDYSSAYAVLAMMLALALAVVLVVIIVARRYAPELAREKTSTALETLNQRYIKGEITREEYLRMKKDIEKT